jgi:hypothetical protein
MKTEKMLLEKKARFVMNRILRYYYRKQYRNKDIKDMKITLKRSNSEALKWWYSFCGPPDPTEERKILGMRIKEI